MSEEKKPSFDVSWDAKEQVARIKVRGIPDQEATTVYAKESRALLAKLEAKGLKANRILYDITEAGKPDYNARRIIVEVAREVAQKYSDLKLAYVGMGAMRKTISQVINWLADIGTVKFFATEEEALKWLRE